MSSWQTPGGTIVCRQCGATYVYLSEWDRLEWVGMQPDGDGGMLELRNCPCGSTLSWEVKPSRADVAHDVADIARDGDAVVEAMRARGVVT